MRVVMLKNKTSPSDSYFDHFQANGHDVAFVPLLRHGPVSIDATTKYLTSDEFIKEVDLFIITSQRAVEVFHQCLKRIEMLDPSMAEDIRSKPGYTVGPATEAILKANGFIDVRGGRTAGNGSKLADIIINDIQHSSPSIVFFTGEIRKDVIPAKLKSRGTSVKEKVIYKTEPKEDITSLFELQCLCHNDWIVFFSPQGTEGIVNFIQNSPASQRFKIASIGPTTQEYLQENGIRAQVVAREPTAHSLLEGLHKWAETQQQGENA